jgi:ABC-type Na+ efflux pump permease subunit
MKKMSPFKSLYYTGLSALVVLVSAVFLVVINLLPSNFGISTKKEPQNIVVVDTSYQKVVLYDTVSQKVVKPVKTTSNEVVTPHVEVKKEILTPILDTTK